MSVGERCETSVIFRSYTNFSNYFKIKLTDTQYLFADFPFEWACRSTQSIHKHCMVLKNTYLSGLLIFTIKILLSVSLILFCLITDSGIDVAM